MFMKYKVSFILKTNSHVYQATEVKRKKVIVFNFKRKSNNRALDHHVS